MMNLCLMIALLLGPPTGHPDAPVSTPAPPTTSGPETDVRADQTTERDADAAGTPAVVAEADPAVVAVLQRLERAADGLKTFTARVTHKVEDDFDPDGTVIRKGEVLYDASGAARRVAILFNHRVVREELRKELRHYVFSGIWLVERDYTSKLFIKRQIARPGEAFDPLKLGEGPFPLPIGQAPVDVLRRFDVSLAELPATGLLAKLAERETPIDGLHLVPRPGSAAARDFDSVDLYYDRSTGLPVGVRMLKNDGDRTETARLDDLRANPTLAAAELQRLSVEEPDPSEQWRVDIRPLDGS